MPAMVAISWTVVSVPPDRANSVAAALISRERTSSLTTLDGSNRGNARLTHLQRLEAESVHILREATAESERPVMLYSVGKDSTVMLHLARKAFYPSRPPFPLLHVDTTWKFREMIESCWSTSRPSRSRIAPSLVPCGYRCNGSTD